jgi:hypothetical protein
MTFTRLKVVKVIFSNLDLDLLSQELRVKFGEIYKRVQGTSTSKISKKKKCFMKVVKI